MKLRKMLHFISYRLEMIVDIKKVQRRESSILLPHL